jgi:hypothetical protein
MINDIYINKIKMMSYSSGTSKFNPSRYILMDGSFRTKDNLREDEVYIQCKGDSSLYRIKSITSAHLSKPYYGFKWRGLNKNPFKGKSHSLAFKNKLSKERKGKWCIGKNNAMFGKTNYSIWLEKYGKEEADKLESIRQKKFSISISGINNPFF